MDPSLGELHLVGPVLLSTTLREDVLAVDPELPVGGLQPVDVVVSEISGPPPHSVLLAFEVDPATSKRLTSAESPSLAALERGAMVPRRTVAATAGTVE